MGGCRPEADIGGFWSNNGQLPQLEPKGKTDPKAFPAEQDAQRLLGPV
jgi:hypothetical protein